MKDINQFRKAFNMDISIFKTMAFLIATMFIWSCSKKDSISQPEALAVTAKPGIDQVTVKWTPVNSGNFGSYWISYYPGDGLSVIKEQTKDSVVFSDLDPNIDYRFTVVWVDNNKVRSLPAIVNAKPEALFVEPEVLYDDDLTIEKQEQLDALPLLYTKISGRLRISGADITNLSKLKNLRTVGKNLEILDKNTALTSLAGLEKLRTISGNLWIRKNAALTSVEALKQLTKIEGNLYFYDNAVVKSLSGFDNLIEVKDVFIGDRGTSANDGKNPLLTDFCALKNLFSLPAGGRTVVIAQNGYNPTVQQIATGTCAK
ncbi:fibronectin type III domain-containing protein [Pedobacter endophyticus]|uniref:Fibronectin type III domain-containing protein n=1 Tax=Pedobacter endophyticus TaxID=2789740 RepID=A0A7U3Q6G6_9SPHI|nr:fibronectin type III domain-containing protein [Pedobacter endophyticus]QPH38555.1 fibronectin type III domain-containing protein [Pedobacter endophyticus]